MSEEKLVRILKDLPLFAKNFLVISNKKGGEGKFHLNRAQLYVYAKLYEQLTNHGKVRANVLKGRQQGVSTLIQAIYFHIILLNKGMNAFILTHLSDATRAIFEMTKRYSENLEEELFPQPEKKNDNILSYKNFGRYRVGTAGNENIGRSMTNHLLHLSEYAFYKKAESISLGLLQTVADVDGTWIIKESTANGINNDFYREWIAADAGDSQYINIFVPWYWQDEYTAKVDDFIPDSEEEGLIKEYGDDGLTHSHLVWRRTKLMDFKGDYEQKCRQFRQEYPFYALEAFINSITNTFIQVECVQKARKIKVESESNLIIGIDVAWSKDRDKTAIIRRRGRRAYGLETHHIQDSVKLIRLIANIIDKERPAKVYIDGISAGGPIVDSLQEKGYDCVEGVIVSKTAFDETRFSNLRAELWSKMRDWLTQDMPVQIPDSDELQTDLTGLQELEDSRRRLLIESKKAAKERKVTSPDTADALMLTFYGGEYVSEGRYEPRFLPERTAGMLI